jgi:non-specific serine/threonine protein kinase
MYTINLDTFNEDRLLKSVDPETLQLGKELFEKGAAQVVELLDLTARCVVQDKRNFHIQFKISKQHLFLRCSCSHAARGLICEHDVAAWLAIQEKLTEQIPPEWRMQVEKLVTSNLRSQRSRPAPYLLFYSLQKDLQTSSLTWRITPHILPLSSLPREIAQVQFDPVQWRDYVEENPESSLRLRSPHLALEADDCINCSREGIKLANLLYERRSAYLSYALQPFPIQDYLSLIRKTGGQLFLGDSDRPLRKYLEIAANPAETYLNLNLDEKGLHITPELTVDGQVLEMAPTDLQVILDTPTWILSNRLLVELSNPSDLELLKNFRSTPELLVPSSDIEDFANQYLLDLAQQTGLQGNALTWENLAPEPIPRLYLNESNGELIVQLKFAYQDIELSCESTPPAESVQRKPESLTLVRVIRQPEKEKFFFDQLSGASFGMKRAPLPSKAGLFRLRARTHPVDFLLNSLPRLAQAGYEIFGEEKLKTARVNRNTPTISFQVSSGIDWFDVQAVVNFGELEVPLQDIRRLLRKRERYVKLPDGSIGEIPEVWLERYHYLFTMGDPQDAGLRFSRHHMFLIDQALKDADSLSLDQEFENQRLRLRELLARDFQGISARPLPPGFVGELRPYQKAGFDWLHFLRDYQFGGCLADDMGLGKTIQALVFLQSIYHAEQGDSAPTTASLLVVPRSLLVNWQREAARFTPNLRILEFFESDRLKEPSAFKDVDLVITTYGVMLRDIQLLHGYEFHYAILDESQSIKNPLSQTARAAHLLRARHRLVLTGTPVENSTAELWSQFAFLNPGLLGNLKYFKTEFGLPIEKKHDERAVENLRKIVYPFILRRTKDQVAPELPPRTERTLYCDMEPAQRKLYNRTRDLYRGMLLGMLDKQGLNESRMKILEGLLRLRQISNHPQLVDEKSHASSGKFELLLETMETLQAEGHKALVFSQFVQMLSLVRREIDQRQYRYTYLDGQTQARQEQVDIFQSDPSIPFFLISLKAGGLGLNLTAADYVIHIDPWWNPAVEMQASDRTHRIGQDKPVFVFKLITRDSVEEKILILQDRKKDLVDQIITTESTFFKDLTVKDIEYLFGESGSADR